MFIHSFIFLITYQSTPSTGHHKLTFRATAFFYLAPVMFKSIQTPEIICLKPQKCHDTLLCSFRLVSLTRKGIKAFHTPVYSGLGISDKNVWATGPTVLFTLPLKYTVFSNLWVLYEKTWSPNVKSFSMIVNINAYSAVCWLNPQVITNCWFWSFKMSL